MVGLNTSYNALRPYIELMRLHRPIGTYLVLWPVLIALWIAAQGVPQWPTLLVFTLGGLLMRSAGCVINDYADRDIDSHVSRTKNRPLATGLISPKHALILFGALVFVAFLLVLTTNLLTILLSAGALAIAASYPYMKRYTYFPQFVLGAAFAWAVPMAFTATNNELPLNLWLLYIAVLLWTVAYDTFYGMVDRDDDIRIGLKSTAVLFGDMDRLMTGIIQALVVITLALLGPRFGLGWIYAVSLCIVAGLFAYQQYLIRDRDRKACFTAFMNNNWVGMTLFLGVALDYYFSAS